MIATAKPSAPGGSPIIQCTTMPAGHIILPNFTTFCLQGFELRTNPHCNQATEDAMASVEVESGFSPDELRAIPSRQLGLLASLCYPSCDLPDLRLVIRCLVSWERKTRGDGTWECSNDDKRLIAGCYRGATDDWPCRFNEDLMTFKRAQAQAVAQNKAGDISDVESYKILRRTSSGVMLLLDLVEISGHIQLPEPSHTSTKFISLKQSASDIIVWSQDMASYNRKQAVGDNHNLVAVLTARNGFVQIGVDEARAMLRDAFHAFHAAEEELLTGTRSVHPEIRRYIQGLRDCIVGHAHWLYYTNLFFEDGEDAKESGWVRLLPKETKA
ncbi:hypothetical protein EIP91_008189 [Steccherinum ochraceum]|uniref:Terpene synthase n=1 Tax=Steccherinum ochraceum TaxID=92696 RepID=A0A4R0R5I2_9APHY|nr:hypothetical protein EIP91_008189 [Steccherinum ochraceum]